MNLVYPSLLNDERNKIEKIRFERCYACLTKEWYLCFHKDWQIIYCRENIFLFEGNSAIKFNFQNDENMVIIVLFI